MVPVDLRSWFNVHLLYMEVFKLLPVASKCLLRLANMRHS